jgi:tellurite resistance protein
VDDQKGFKERGRALEEEFFQREHERLREKLCEKQEREEIRAELQAVSGIDDEALLDALADLGLQADTLAALSLVPLVEVAWADGKLEPNERKALLDAAKDAGIDQRHPCYELFDGWMAQRPSGRMLEVWAGYVGALAHSLDAARYAQLRERILGRARAVAVSAGGFLGLKKISPEEEKILGILDRAFEA